MTTAKDPSFFKLLTGSYKHLLGHAPIFLNGPGTRDTAAVGSRWLYENAQACVLAHDIAAEPVFIYANKAAQALFEYQWDEIIGLPSHLSAEAPNRAERKQLLDTVARNGFATDYSGVRITKSGRRFRINDGILWELRDSHQELRGVAATFQNWTFLG